MANRWRISRPDEETTRLICQQTGCHPVIAAVLANRGITARKDISAFLNPSLKDIRFINPFADMDRAVKRIRQAIISREKILIFGDYDVDGVTATVVLFEFLKHTGTDVDYYIPHRITEGYGLSVDQIKNCAIPTRVDLIITVDCGSGSHEAIRCANESGIDVIVTDHHAAAPPLPEAAAMVNPRRPDCPSGFGFLAGVGVVFYLLLHLRKHLRDTGFYNTHPEPNLRGFCDLVALGTVADIVPLIRENRIITATGLDVINAGLRPGIKALVEICLSGKPRIDAEDIAYRLGPRINAAGRMEHAKLAVELLMAKDTGHARGIAEKINALNARRQTVEERIFQHTLMFLDEEQSLLKNRSLVLGNTGWHEGVLGIVASKLAERFYRPVVLISFTDQKGKGSARSIPGIDLYEAIDACSGLLEKYGGHPMAAGLSIKHKNFAPFQQAFEEKIRSMAPPDDLDAGPAIDAELGLDMISEELMEQIEKLKPFGAQNPEPLFLSTNVAVTFSKPVKDKHQQLVLKQYRSDEQKKIRAIWFYAQPDTREKRYFKRIAYSIRRDHFNGGASPQLVIEKAE